MTTAKKIVRKFDRSNVRVFHPEGGGAGFMSARADHLTRFASVVVTGAVMSTAKGSDWSLPNN